jgi:hypothetical protein
MGGDATVTIPIGTYSATQLRDQLETSLNDASPNGWTYSITFSSITAKYTFDVSGNSSSQPSFTFTTNVYENLGFLANTTNTFVADTLTSTTVIDVSPENNVMLRSNMVDAGSTNEDILIDLQGSGIPPFGRIQFYNNDVEAYSRKLNNSSTLVRFYITNEDSESSGLQRILQLNQKNWTATIVLYKKTILPELIKNIIRLNAID